LEKSVDSLRYQEEEDDRSSDGALLDFDSLPAGLSPGYKVVKEYPIHRFANDDHPRDESDPTATLDQLVEWGRLTGDDLDRLKLTDANVSVPVALMMLDPRTYPSLSRARKACRKRTVVVVANQHNNISISSSTTKEAAALSGARIGLVGDRVLLSEVRTVQVQQRFGSGSFRLGPLETLSYAAAANDHRITLPILYEDDHVAIVHKPAGLLVYRSPQSSPRAPTVHAALPWCLKAPARGTPGALTRPLAVHRLDKPTSGCLVIAKTKPALVHLGRQFHDRAVSKTYTALVNGRLPRGAAIAENDSDARAGDDEWNVIEEPLEGKEAITYWRVLGESPCAFALDQTLSWTELRPRTGRFHQLRRHLATVLDRPIVGDDDYDGNSPSAQRLRDRGLFLCATRITLEHPWYNTPQGRRELDSHRLPRDSVRFPNLRASANKFASEGFGHLWTDNSGGGEGSGTIMITAEVSVPSKFHGLVLHEQERFLKFHKEGA
jgi:23S rRNA-/tRNA-specific pseudouridylate synthase